MWWLAIARADVTRTSAHARAHREALAAAQAYEQYITRSVAQMDQVSMQLKESWERSQGQLLERLGRQAMFVDSVFISVGIVDRTGTIVSTTRSAELGQLHSTDAFFNFHKNNNSSSLRIGPPPGAATQAHGAILFSRRLETADDEFAGVVFIVAPAHYLTSFYMPSTLGREGMVATVGIDSTLRAESAPVAPAGPGRSLFPALAGRESASAGAALFEGSNGFPDGRARLLGWQKSPVYPLVGLVAMSYSEAMASADTDWTDARNSAILATICMLLAAGVAMSMSRRVSEQVVARDDVRRAYRTATESGNDGFYMAAAVRDDNGQIVDFEIVDCNERGAYFYGFSRTALIGTRLSSIAAGGFGKALFATYCTAMEAGFYEDEREMPADNRLNITWGHRRLVRVGNGLAITLSDISERKAHVAALQRAANEDLLTGLFNRHWLMEFLPPALARAGAAGQSIALLFIDLDEFKYINDAHGHATGDQVLSAAAQRLRSLLRPADHVVRFGGDEFIVLLMPAETDAQTAMVADRIVAAFAAPFLLGEERHAAEVSVGISMFPRNAGDAATLISQSDIAMHVAKAEGKGRSRFFDPSMSHTLQTRSQLKHSLIEALDKQQFVLYYQPKVDAFTGALCGMEALVRWVHPVHGVIPPLEFIPFAETSGLIRQIGEQVMDMACAQLAAWRAQGHALVPVSINVSPRQFASGDVHRKLTTYLERHHIAPALLEIEITESAMMGDDQNVLAELSAIRDLGVKLHVDDFGTGYSSLSQLQKMKMDVLKVDRAFTSALGQSREGTVFFQAIVSMAHALGMSVVAEGVETHEQLQLLQELKCNEVQGYFIARPLPAAGMSNLMHGKSLFPV